MTEQQEQLQKLVERRAAVIEEVNALRAEANAKAELVIRLEGAIEGLSLVGIELPAEAAPELPEVPAAEAPAEAPAEEAAPATRRHRRASAAS